MKPVLILRTGRAPEPIRARHGDFPHWFRLGTQLPPERLHIIDATTDEPLPAPGDVAGAMITGAAAMVTDRAAWSERAADWIREAMNRQLPLFGVCFGHQLMAHALGGEVGYLPGGREIGSVPTELLDAAASDPLARQLPARFRTQTTHEQSVLTPPDGAIVLSRSARDPHHFLRYGPHAVSVQFHPEFSADVMRAYIRRKWHDLQREGADPQQLFNAVAATPVARSLLRRFARLSGW